jgi:phosphoglycolate phosphatase-like HAD superfamily hydrolase
MKPTVFLFDIDGTLITTGGVGRAAIERAFERLYSRPDAFKSISFAGMTDRAIVRAGLMAIGRKPGEADIDDAITAYVAVLEEEVSRADTATYKVHAGIEMALDETSWRSHSAVGLGTGNIRAGARVKLERVGLYQRFAFGGFGCDHEDRAELIRIGAERGASALDRKREDCRVVVIGDTPKDVAAARAIGAESIGVGTGPYTPADLMACGATYACRDLSEPGALDRLLG